MPTTVIDVENSDMSAYFDEAMKIIEDGLKTHFCVLVHCQNARRRRFMLVTAHRLMRVSVCAILNRSFQVREKFGIVRMSPVVKLVCTRSSVHSR